MFHYKKLINGIKNIFNPKQQRPPNVVKPVDNQDESIPLLNKPVLAKPLRIPRQEHGMSRNYISKNALNVLYGLQKAGFQAYLVGGGVRDVLLNRKPKDFDVVTNAHPEQIKRIFRNCRLIGRRFLLAHVYFGQFEYVEVVTFRAFHTQGGEGGSTAADGRIVRDNVYGHSVEEDALRRDFTVNAIYYDIADFSLLDFANGIKDLEEKTIRLIGDPILRYQEDPVRMLRAIRFAAKLDFTIEPSTAEPIYGMAHLLAGIPNARLYDEVLKLFLTGHGAKCLPLLRHYGIFAQLFPQVENVLQDALILNFIEISLRNTDQRLDNDLNVMPAFLFACFLWHPMIRLFKTYSEQYNEQEALIYASHEVIMAQTKQVAVPHRIAAIVKEMWLLQLRLTRARPSKRQRASIMTHERFRAAYDFLLLRVESGETELAESADQWRKLQVGEVVEESAVKSGVSRLRRKRRRNKPPKSTPQSAD